MAALQQRVERGDPVNPRTLRETDPLLVCAVQRHFNQSWRSAFDASGLDPDHHLCKRRAISDPALVLDWIRTRHEAGLPLRQIDVDGVHRREFVAAVRCFGSWGNALAAAGLNARDFVRSRKQHAPERDVKRALQRLRLESDRPFTRELVRDADWSLLSDALHWAARDAGLAKNACARWHHVLAWLGVSADYHAHRDRRRLKGIRFERLAQRAWQRMDPTSEEHLRVYLPSDGHRRYVEPDRARGRELFIEFRLAATVQAVTSAVARYEGLCTRLLIVVLEGSYRQSLPAWVEVKSIFDFEAPISAAGESATIRKLRALARGSRVYVPEKWTKATLIAALHQAPAHVRGDATAIRKWFLTTHKSTATRRLDRLRGTFAATCYAEGLTSAPGTGRRPHVPARYRTAVLYRMITSRRALGLPVDDARDFYAGPRGRRRLYEYACQEFGGWRAMLSAIDALPAAPPLPSDLNPGLLAQ